MSYGTNDREKVEKVELKALNNSDLYLCCRPRKASDLDCPTSTLDFTLSVICREKQTQPGTHDLSEHVTLKNATGK